MTVAVSIDVRDLLGHPGESRRVRVEEAVPRLATELVRVPEDAPVDVLQAHRRWHDAVYLHRLPS